MRKVSTITIILVALVVIVFFVINTRDNQTKNTALIADQAEFLVYTVDGQPTGSAFISLKFTKENPSMIANVLADINENGLFEAEKEWIVKNTRVTLKPNFPNRISFPIGESNLTEMESISIRILLSPEIIEASEDATEEKIVGATVRKFDSSEQLGIGVPGASLELKRGTLVWSATVKAQSESVDIQLDSLPDLSSGPMDCFPVAAANNLIYLANKNGKRDQLPTNPQDIIDELKNDLKFDNGVLLNNFEEGEKAFIERYELPIKTTRIDKPDFEDIKNAIESGGVVELSTGLTQSASGKINTGHVVAVSGVISDGGRVGFTASDPATPVGGAEIYELTPPPPGSDVWTFNYPLWDGITFIDAIFVQTWGIDGQAVSSTPESNPTPIKNQNP
ncbi:MAG: hypothetical protein Q7R86_00335 [bacterium]|nr:hypothetical protein [bacterium]